MTSGFNPPAAGAVAYLKPLGQERVLTVISCAWRWDWRVLGWVF